MTLARGVRYLLTVKRNQPGLHARLAALPWRDVPESVPGYLAGCPVGSKRG
jgi:hypothetical protein